MRRSNSSLENATVPRLPSDIEDLAREAFMVEAAPRLVREVARTLAAHGIPVMPLKGVLLQRLVYGDGVFRRISDVDILVPSSCFSEAHTALLRAGFRNVFWEKGRWQATLENPSGIPLGIDLHRNISRTPRSRLTPDRMFERSSGDEGLFGVAVRIPSPYDLFAHVLLHGMLHWLMLGQVHRPRDFSAIAARFSLDEEGCAEYVADLGLATHALAFLPMTLKAVESPFIRGLLAKVHHRADLRGRLTAAAILNVLSNPQTGRISRRLAGLALAPSLPGAIKAGIVDRGRSTFYDFLDRHIAG